MNKLIFPLMLIRLSLPAAADTPVFRTDFSDITAKETLRFSGVREQGFDTTCGLASAATLLSYWNIAADEEALISELFPETESSGGSYTVNMQQLSEVLQNRGLQTQGFNMNTGQLRNNLERFAPILIHYVYPEIHFAVLLGFTNGHFIVADPGRGVEIVAPAVMERRRTPVTLLAASNDLSIDEDAVSEVIARAGVRIEHAGRFLW